MARARRELNDLKKKRWRDDHLEQIVIDALAQVAAVRPDYFLRAVDVEVHPGDSLVVECCDRVSRVDGIVGEGGLISQFFSRSEFLGERDYTRKVCDSPAKLRAPTGYSIDPERPNVVHFTSTMPPGPRRLLRVWCSGIPPIKSSSQKLSLPNEAVLDIQRMVVSIANGSETDSLVAQNVSASNEARVYRTTSVRKKAADDMAKKGA